MRNQTRRFPRGVRRDVERARDHAKGDRRWPRPFGFCGKMDERLRQHRGDAGRRRRLRLAIETRPVYGPGSDRRRQCKVSAEVKLPSGGRSTGAILPDDAQPAGEPKAEPAESAFDQDLPPGCNTSRRYRRWRMARRSAIVLRIHVAGHRDYFASGKSDTSDKADTSFVAPTLIAPAPRPRATRSFAPIRTWPTTTGS